MPIPALIRRHAAYLVFATTSLALSVGATLVVFTIVNALWLRPLPFPEADRLVMLTGDTGGSDEAMWFAELETPERWTAFEAVAGQVATSGAMGGLEPHILFEQVGHEVETLGVTSQYFRLFGQAIRGRDFTRHDNRAGAAPVAIISDRLWSRAFGRRTDAIGAMAAAEPFPIRIIGVAPAGFEGARRGERADVWIPANLVPRVAPGGSGIPEDRAPALAFARLRPGQTTSEAKRLYVDGIVDERFRRAMERVQVVPLKDVFGTPDARTVVIREQRAGSVVVGLASLVLLAGCATLMALVLVHYERRRRELAIRIALGATRGRLAAELSGELAWIAAAGTAAALLVAVWSLRTLPALSLPGGVDPGRLDLSIDWRVVTAGVMTSVVTLFAAAAMPVSRFTRGRLAGELSAAGSTLPASSQRLRQVLLGLHVSATIVVLVAAGLFVRAVLYGFSAGPGFDVDRTMFVRVQAAPPFADIGEGMDARRALIAERTRRLEDAFRSLPGVEEVATGPSPIGADEASYLLTPKTVETRDQRREMRLGVLSGSSELLSALGVPIVRGRPLTAADAKARPRPAVVTVSLARTLWPQQEPLGQTVSPGFRQGTYTIVGIVPDFVYGSLTQASAGVVISVRPSVFGGMEPRFVLRTLRPEGMVNPVRRIVEDVVPGSPHVVVTTGRDIIARDLGRQRLGAWFFSGFGLVALVLGAGGVFGLVAYLAESRRREFGVRLALGATPGDLVWRGLIAGLAPVSIGAAAGLLIAAPAARVFVTLIPGLSALDPVTYLCVAALMMACAAAASLTAAARLRGVAPSEALRS